MGPLRCEQCGANCQVRAGCEAHSDWLANHPPPPLIGPFSGRAEADSAAEPGQRAGRAPAPAPTLAQFLSSLLVDLSEA